MLNVQTKFWYKVYKDHKDLHSGGKPLKHRRLLPSIKYETINLSLVKAHFVFINEKRDLSMQVRKTSFSFSITVSESVWLSIK